MCPLGGMMTRRMRSCIGGREHGKFVVRAVEEEHAQRIAHEFRKGKKGTKWKNAETMHMLEPRMCATYGA